MEKFLIEIIVTNACNKKCEYCDLNFKQSFIKDDYIEKLAYFINNSQNVEYFHINFFWWEPLLAYKKLEKFVNYIKISNVKYSVWTNGYLLDNEKLNFFYKNEIGISLSVDNITGFNKIKKIEEKFLGLIEINFVNDPDYLLNSIRIFDETIKMWFKTINFMPVFTTKKWDMRRIAELYKILEYVISYKDKLNINFFGYLDNISPEKQFILDTDGYFYADIDSLLWVQKQYTCVNDDLKKEIDNTTKKCHLLDKDFSFEKLSASYNLKELIDLSVKIPRELKDLMNILLINKFLENAKRQ